MKFNFVFHLVVGDGVCSTILHMTETIKSIDGLPLKMLGI